VRLGTESTDWPDSATFSARSRHQRPKRFGRPRRLACLESFNTRKGALNLVCAWVNVSGNRKSAEPSRRSSRPRPGGVNEQQTWPTPLLGRGSSKLYHLLKSLSAQAGRSRRNSFLRSAQFKLSRHTLSLRKRLSLKSMRITRIHAATNAALYTVFGGVNIKIVTLRKTM